MAERLVIIITINIPIVTANKCKSEKNGNILGFLLTPLNPFSLFPLSLSICMCVFSLSPTQHFVSLYLSTTLFNISLLSIYLSQSTNFLFTLSSLFFTFFLLLLFLYIPSLNYFPPLYPSILFPFFFLSHYLFILISDILLLSVFFVNLFLFPLFFLLFSHSITILLLTFFLSFLPSLPLSLFPLSVQDSCPSVPTHSVGQLTGSPLISFPCSSCTFHILSLSLSQSLTHILYCFFFTRIFSYSNFIIVTYPPISLFGPSIVFLHLHFCFLVLPYSFSHFYLFLHLSSPTFFFSHSIILLSLTLYIVLSFFYFLLFYLLPLPVFLLISFSLFSLSFTIEPLFLFPHCSLTFLSLYFYYIVFLPLFSSTMTFFILFFSLIFLSLPLLLQCLSHLFLFHHLLLFHSLCSLIFLSLSLLALSFSPISLPLAPSFPFSLFLNLSFSISAPALFFSPISLLLSSSFPFSLFFNLPFSIFFYIVFLPSFFSTMSFFHSLYLVLHCLSQLFLHYCLFLTSSTLSLCLPFSQFHLSPLQILLPLYFSFLLPPPLSHLCSIMICKMFISIITFSFAFFALSFFLSLSQVLFSLLSLLLSLFFLISLLSLILVPYHVVKFVFQHIFMFKIV
ncbi:unnamed protein product [Acanthosepion pharaonis]|uniref:Uncharacterized protein n=1 Tax=Acanthosepion pharaonis TaxID=158019 RepID=A0A812DWD4_ACAPH|nr:unnamed protein product [Sepia pharaonis]